MERGNTFSRWRYLVTWKMMDYCVCVASHWYLRDSMGWFWNSMKYRYLCIHIIWHEISYIYTTLATDRRNENPLYGAVAPARPSTRSWQHFCWWRHYGISHLYRYRTVVKRSAYRTLFDQRKHCQLVESNTARIIMGDYGKAPVVPWHSSETWIVD
jgi:hypothetical protein